MKIERTYSGAPWEQDIGYCQAIRAGNHIYVSGSTPLTDDSHVYRPGDGFAQAQRCCEIISRALADLGAGMNQVVRTRMFVTDISHWADFGRAHGEAFGAHPPATTMVQVATLIDPDMMIEIEAEAILPAANDT
ncbi:MAG: RidA family protein [Candidatus Marinimicrobia bacterium]|nr:RidA family protein [Candidatus Neomarinimicrobiota bacterium]